jgi:hypothetical protein
MKKDKTVAKLSVRKSRKNRQKKQNETINYLRMVYFLCPEKLSIVKNKFGEISDNYIKDLVKYTGNSLQNTNASWEIRHHIETQELFLNDLLEGWLDKNTIDDIAKNKIREDQKQRMLNHWNNTEYLLMMQKGSNPKSIHLDSFVEKIIAHQNFELAKSNTINKTPKKKPLSYLDYLKNYQKRNPKELYIKTAIKENERSNRILNSSKKKKRITDKDLAESLYKKIDNKSLQKVRQDRSRLKKYHLL